jgi:hypothetical protein
MSYCIISYYIANRHRRAPCTCTIQHYMLHIIISYIISPTMQIMFTRRLAAAAAALTYIILHYITLYCITLHYIISYHIVQCTYLYTFSHPPELHGPLLTAATHILYNVALFYMLCYDMIRVYHIMLHYSILYHQLIWYKIIWYDTIIFGMLCTHLSCTARSSQQRRVY